jgi:hypothetical protein
MSNFKSEEIESKSLNAYFNKDEEKSDVVQLPALPEKKSEESVEDYDLDEQVEQPAPAPAPEEDIFAEQPCIPGLGVINSRKEKRKPAGSIFDNGRATYWLYGLMGLGLASQLLK